LYDKKWLFGIQGRVIFKNPPILSAQKSLILSRIDLKIEIKEKIKENVIVINFILFLFNMTAIGLNN
jgi:hypothetical protein